MRFMYPPKSRCYVSKWYIYEIWSSAPLPLVLFMDQLTFLQDTLGVTRLPALYFLIRPSFTEN